MKSTTKRDLNFKASGAHIPAGTTLELFFKPNRNDRVYFNWAGAEKVMGLTYASQALTGFSKCPSPNTLEKWMNNGTCKTPTGKTVEPDGHGEDGSPSWLLVMGLI
jgi:hypothetical protein